MNTRFLTEVTTTFNPFSPRAKHARIFLSFLPPTARQNGMKVNTKLLPRSSQEPSALALKFSTSSRLSGVRHHELTEGYRGWKGDDA